MSTLEQIVVTVMFILAVYLIGSWIALPITLKNIEKQLKRIADNIDKKEK